MKTKKIVSLLLALIGAAYFCMGQNALNNGADNIVGVYSSVQGGYAFRAEISKEDDGGYRGRVVWVEKDKDEKGNKILDTKNPDRTLRKTPCDRITLFSGLKYNAQRKRWDSAKIYDPQRGIKAHLVVDFDEDGRLRLKGSLMGISETVYWKRIK